MPAGQHIRCVDFGPNAHGGQWQYEGAAKLRELIFDADRVRVGEHLTSHQAVSLQRNHEVVGYSRSGKNPLDFADTSKVMEIIDDPQTEVTIIAVISGRTGSYEDDIANHKALIDAAPSGRILVVGGASG